MTADFTPKICNFGLSRDIYEQSSYQKLSSVRTKIMIRDFKQLTAEGRSVVFGGTL
jgi:hypothetical protein